MIEVAARNTDRRANYSGPSVIHIKASEVTALTSEQVKAVARGLLKVHVMQEDGITPISQGLKRWMVVHSLEGRQKGDTVQHPGMPEPVVLERTPLSFSVFNAHSSEEAAASVVSTMAKACEVAIIHGVIEANVGDPCSGTFGVYPMGIMEEWKKQPSVRWLLNTVNSEVIDSEANTTRKVA